MHEQTSDVVADLRRTAEPRPVAAHPHRTHLFQLLAGDDANSSTERPAHTG